MYVPIIFGYEIYNEIPVFLGFFYKFVTQCLKYNWPIIAQENYFVNPIEIEKKYNYKIENCFFYHGSNKLNFEDINAVDKYVIPKNISNEIIKQCGSIDNAWIDIMVKKFDILEKYIYKTLNIIKEKYKTSIKAVLLWRHNETIYQLCKKMNIKVIEMEFSTFRYPFYNERISYFQFENKYSTKEFDNRYSEFLKLYKKKLNIPILSRKEILSLFLAEENIEYINKLNDPIIYDIGLAFGLDKDYESKAMKALSNKELYSGFKDLYAKNQTLLKFHPSSTYKSIKSENVDNSKSSADFILKCRRVASVLSNIGLESMLYGKTSYVLGNMPFKNICVSDFKYSDEVSDLLSLNYIVFVFLAPYDLMLDENYLNWRLTYPDETEIYMKHLNYYLKKRKIPLRVLKLKGIKRLKEILEIMGYKDILNLENINYFRTISELNYKVQNLNKKISESNKKISELNNQLGIKNKEIYNLLNSKSWKLTKPIRTIMNVINHGGKNEKN